MSTEADTALHLREMGLRPGVIVRVVGIAAAGAPIVAIGAARIALGRATAQEIEADPA